MIIYSSRNKETMKRLAIVFLILSAGYAQHPNHIRLEDNSDWWSLMKDDTFGAGVKPSDKLLNDADLTIAGIRLGKDSSDVPRKFGATTEIERGDAANGRQQLCYRSPKDETFLIFEWGEEESAAYLFDSNKSWSGRDKCSPLKLVNRQIATVRGLRLGSSVEDVTHVLGKPTQQADGAIVYSFQADKKNSPGQIAKFLKEYKEANGSEGNPKDYQHQTVTSYIEARFQNSRMTYFAIITDETF
jgi:hypothetical protein